MTLGRFLPIVLALSLPACRAKEGERCVCADDCKDGLVCLAGGRVLADGECSPAVGEDSELGECLDENAAGLGEDGFPEPELYMDLGSKRDFDPAIPPDPSATESDSGTASSTTDATSAGTSTTDGDTTSTGSTGSTGSSSTTGSGSTGASSSSGGV